MTKNTLHASRDAPKHFTHSSWHVTHNTPHMSKILRNPQPYNSIKVDEGL